MRDGGALNPKGLAAHLLEAGTSSGVKSARTGTMKKKKTKQMMMTTAIC